MKKVMVMKTQHQIGHDRVEFGTEWRRTGLEKEKGPEHEIAMKGGDEMSVPL